MWSYLDSLELDARLQLIAGYLLSRKEVATIFDLNCGKAPLLRHLDVTSFFYFGNDINESYVDWLWKNYPSATWFHRPDHKVTAFDIDCLVCLGIACGNGEFQSKTVYNTIVRFADSDKPPSIIILEHWAGFEDPPLSRLAEYEVKFAWELSPINPTIKYARRRIWILERQS